MAQYNNQWMFAIKVSLSIMALALIIDYAGIKLSATQLASMAFWIGLIAATIKRWIEEKHVQI